MNQLLNVTTYKKKLQQVKMANWKELILNICQYTIIASTHEDQMKKKVL